MLTCPRRTPAMLCLALALVLAGEGSALADGDFICGRISDHSTFLGLTGIRVDDHFLAQLTLDPGKANNGTPGEYDCTLGGPCGIIDFTVMDQDLTGDFVSISQTETSWDGQADLPGFVIPAGGTLPQDMVFLSGTVDVNLTDTGNTTATITPDFDEPRIGGTLTIGLEAQSFGHQEIIVGMQSQGLYTCNARLGIDIPALSPPALALLATCLAAGALGILLRRPGSRFI